MPLGAQLGEEIREEKIASWKRTRDMPMRNECQEHPVTLRALSLPLKALATCFLLTIGMAICSPWPICI